MGRERLFVECGGLPPLSRFHIKTKSKFERKSSSIRCARYFVREAKAKPNVRANQTLSSHNTDDLTITTKGVR